MPEDEFLQFVSEIYEYQKKTIKKMKAWKNFNNDKKTVIVTGCSGQDGSLIIEYLLKNTDYNIIGTIRTSSKPNLDNVSHLLSESRLRVVNLDLADSHSVTDIIRKSLPSYFINLGALTFVPDSWNQPSLTIQTNCSSVIHILEAVRIHCPQCRVYSAGTSEQFANSEKYPQDEKTRPSPRSIYGVSKNAAQQVCSVYRDSYGLYAVHGILFNHESERRPERFVTRKITTNVARIKKALVAGDMFEPMELGNVDTQRDWSHAEDFVDGIWRLLNQDEYPNWDGKVKDYVLSSNETHTIREFVEKAFNEAGIKGEWTGEGESTKYIIKESGTPLMIVNKDFYRPAEVDLLLGNSNKARADLGWTPKNSFDDLVKRMVKSDLEQA